MTDSEIDALLARLRVILLEQPGLAAQLQTLLALAENPEALNAAASSYGMTPSYAI